MAMYVTAQTPPGLAPIVDALKNATPSLVDKIKETTLAGIRAVSESLTS